MRTLRPEYLRPSTYRTMEAQRTYATVYIDDRLVGGLDALTLVPIGEIIEVQYLKAVAAGSMYGPTCACPGGVIAVRTRRDRH